MKLEFPFAKKHPFLTVGLAGVLIEVVLLLTKEYWDETKLQFVFRPFLAATGFPTFLIFLDMIKDNNFPKLLPVIFALTNGIISFFAFVAMYAVTRYLQNWMKPFVYILLVLAWYCFGRICLDAFGLFYPPT